MKESDIIYENGPFWVFKGKGAYFVMAPKVTHSESESAYALDDDGLSLAKARCDYLAKRHQQ